jgi:hypothetical protein
MRTALADLKLQRLVVVHAGEHSFDMAKNIAPWPTCLMKLNRGKSAWAQKCRGDFLSAHTGTAVILN